MEIVRCEECANRHSPFFCPMVQFTADGKYDVYETNGDDDFCSRFVSRGKRKGEDGPITVQYTFAEFLNRIVFRR